MLLALFDTAAGLEKRIGLVLLSPQENHSRTALYNFPFYIVDKGEIVFWETVQQSLKLLASRHNRNMYVFRKPSGIQGGALQQIHKATVLILR